MWWSPWYSIWLGEDLKVGSLPVTLSFFLLATMSITAAMKAKIKPAMVHENPAWNTYLGAESKAMYWLFWEL